MKYLNDWLNKLVRAHQSKTKFNKVTPLFNKLTADNNNFFYEKIREGSIMKSFIITIFFTKQKPASTEAGFCLSISYFLFSNTCNAPV